MKELYIMLKELQYRLVHIFSFENDAYDTFKENLYIKVGKYNM